MTNRTEIQVGSTGKPRTLAVEPWPDSGRHNSWIASLEIVTASGLPTSARLNRAQLHELVAALRAVLGDAEDEPVDAPASGEPWRSRSGDNRRTAP